MNEDLILGVSDFVALVNQTLEYAYPTVVIEGEVSSFNISKNKWVFFDLKDEESTINCFMSVYQLKIAVEDGMRLQIRANPKLTKWGRFSVTVQAMKPVGEGSMNRAFELLKAKLEKEGLFDEGRKRPLPQYPSKIGVISSAGAAGYADFLKILNNRWGGVEVLMADVQVQGDVAPDQIVRAIDHFNQVDEVDVLVIIRGGGSADDLQAFSTEPVARAIAGSRTPTLVGIGHETDISLADMVADLRAATPSNAAELVVPDKSEIINYINNVQRQMPDRMLDQIERRRQHLSQSVQFLSSQLLAPKAHVELLAEKLRLFNPSTVLKKGYSLTRSEKGGVINSVKQIKKGDKLMIELSDGKAGVVADGR